MESSSISFIFLDLGRVEVFKARTTLGKSVLINLEVNKKTYLYVQGHLWVFNEPVVLSPRNTIRLSSVTQHRSIVASTSVSILVQMWRQPLWDMAVLAGLVLVTPEPWSTL